jgi:F-type H+-transporting ATPase subunit epsilon
VANLDVDLVAADRKIWSGPATMVVAPASEGEIGILPGHAPVLAVLRAGEVRITPVSGELLRGTIDSGFLSVDADRVTIVAATVTLVTGTETR